MPDGAEPQDIGFEGMAAYRFERDISDPQLEEICEVSLDALLKAEWDRVQECLDGGIWPSPVPSSLHEALQRATDLELHAFEIFARGSKRVGWVVCQSVEKLGRRNNRRRNQ